MKILNVVGFANLISSLQDVSSNLINGDGQCLRSAIYNLGGIIEKMECIRVQEEEQNAVGKR